MKKNILKPIGAFALIFALTGCSGFESQIPDMSESEQELVVEYAAETLLRYDVKGGGRIKQINEEIFKKPEVIGDMDANVPDEPAEPTPEPESMTMVDNPDVVADTDIIDNTGEGESVYSTVADALGMSDTLDFEYDGYVIVDYYPEDIGNYFVMNAQEGYKLLVIKYIITNKTGSDLNVSMPYGSVRYKVTLNGNTKNALSTLLLNDMAAYSGTLPAGGSEELVVVSEFTQSEVSGVNSLSLLVKSGSATSTVVLQ